MGAMRKWIPYPEWIKRRKAEEEAEKAKEEAAKEGQAEEATDLPEGTLVD